MLMFRNKCYLILQRRKVGSWSKQVFSGIQPTGCVHLGNYLGAIKKWIYYQQSCNSVIFSIVDLHSITLPQEPKELQCNIFNMAATLLACGIDPDRSILFQQSMVKQHPELCWILGTITSINRLAHLPQYKEKSKLQDEIPLGLFVYPVLQAADILLYKATHIPVGEDQVQQIQMAQQLVKTFNHRFGVTFPTPSAVIESDESKRIRSLRDPSKKMSKSDTDVRSRITLMDSPDVILEKCKKAMTDFTSQVTYEPDTRPAVANLLNIHSLLTGQSVAQICDEAVGLNTGQYKLRLADVIVSTVEPVRQRILQLLENKAYLEQVLQRNACKAAEKAESTMCEVRSKVGLAK